MPISESVMAAWARLVMDCRAADIQRTVKLTDALIAATAKGTHVPDRHPGRIVDGKLHASGSSEEVPLHPARGRG
ncbi:MAG: hypothetical protein ACRDRT_07395, partial [Pseudonocardiaceae bacterium]